MLRNWLMIVMFSMSGVATATPTPHWVVGSYVNVRSQPSRQAPVIAHITANTSVTLLAQADEYCEISWDSSQRGFVACNLLGKQALRIEDVGTKNPPTLPPHPHYSPLRAFWVEPTVNRLFDAGEHLRTVMLPAEQLRLEDKFSEEDGGGSAPELKRFQIPEFEAMKALMTGGLIAPRSQFIPLVGWDHLRTLLKPSSDDSTTSSHQLFLRLTPRIWLDGAASYVQMYKQIALPAAKTSFFKSADAVGRPSAGAEELSAQFQIAHRIAVLDKPTWGGDNNSGPILMGSWDIGTVSSHLTRPAYEVAVGADGQIAVGETEAETRLLRNGDECDGQFMSASMKRLLPGYKMIKKPWIFFRLATPPVLTKATIITKELSRGKSKPTDNEGLGISSPRRENPSAAHIDLDNDGIEDLFVWDDGGNGLDDLGYQRTRLIFVNLAGKWHLLDGDQIHACGC